MPGRAPRACAGWWIVPATVGGLAAWAAAIHAAMNWVGP